jgi:hypothetical protein
MYRVTYSAPAFRTVVHESVQVLANNIRRLDVQLEVAQVNEAVNVVGSAIALQTDRADLNHQIQSSQISNCRSPATRGATGRRCIS